MENDRAILEAWGKSQPHLQKSVWLYYCYPALQAANARYEPFPGFFADFIPEQFRAFAKAGVRGFFYEPSSRRNGGKDMLHDQLEDYLTYTLADDPSADGAKLIDEFFARYYGPAGNAMKKFYRAVETIYSDPASYKGKIPTRHDEITAWNVLGTPERMKQLGKIMDEVRAAAADSPEEYRLRVKIFDDGVWKKMLRGADAFRKHTLAMSGTMQQTMAPFVPNPSPGNLKTADWSRSGRIPEWCGGLQNEKLSRDISGRIMHDGHFLYLRIEDPVATAFLTNLSEWGDGCEFFFAPQRGEPCIQIGAGHNGKFFLKAYGTDKPSEKGIAVISDLSRPDRFRMDLAVPLKTIGAKPGTMLYFNVLRNRGNKNEACWIPTFGGHFVPQRSGEVWLEKESAPQSGTRP